MTEPLDILVVEDNALNRRLVRDLLVHRGHSVREAVCVEEGLAHLNEQPADVVLLDVQLHDGDGTTVLNAIRDHEKWSKVPVIAVTAFAMRGDRARLLEAGFNEYISKPIDVSHFAQLVESIANE